MKNTDCCKESCFFYRLIQCCLGHSSLCWSCCFVIAVKDCGWCSPVQQRTKDTQLCLKWWQAVLESCLFSHHVLDVLRKTKQQLDPHRSPSECISSLLIGPLCCVSTSTERSTSSLLEAGRTIGSPLWSWLCCLCCSSILWGLGEPYTPRRPYMAASDTTTSGLQ